MSDKPHWRDQKTLKARVARYFWTNVARLKGHEEQPFFIRVPQNDYDVSFNAKTVREKGLVPITIQPLNNSENFIFTMCSQDFDCTPQKEIQPDGKIRITGLLFTFANERGKD